MGIKKKSVIELEVSAMMMMKMSNEADTSVKLDREMSERFRVKVLGYVKV